LIAYLETADDGFGDALNAEFGYRIQLWIKLIFCFEVRGLTRLFNVALKGGFVIDQSGDDVTVAGVAGLDDDHVAIIYFGVNHAFATHLKSEALAAAGEASTANIDLEAADLTGGLDPVGVAGGDVSHDGDLDDFGRIGRDLGHFRLVGAVDTEGAGLAGDALNRFLLFEGAEVAHDGVGALEAELFLDLTNTRPEAVAPFMVLDEYEDFSLPRSQIFHSVHLFT